eukprot:gb/GEZN01021201.1/.p1 GENE.gb/GEZN01021201.1/~~gb/GEZN01021201.1/.p1  ORF type:complete len:149 (-),score=28.12 gb/GEZN01021201.1/:213-626(-)
MAAEILEKWKIILLILYIFILAVLANWKNKRGEGILNPDAALDGSRIPKKSDTNKQSEPKKQTEQVEKKQTSPAEEKKEEKSEAKGEDSNFKNLDPTEKFKLLTERHGVRPRKEAPPPREAYKNQMHWAMRERRLSG